MGYNLWFLCQILILTPVTLWALHSRFMNSLQGNSFQARDGTVNCSCHFMRQNLTYGVALNDDGNFTKEKGYILEECQRKNCLTRMEAHIKAKIIPDYMKNIFLLRSKRHGDILNDTKMPIKEITIKENDYLEMLCNNYKKSIYGVAEMNRSKVKLLWRKDEKVIRKVEVDYNNTILTHHSELSNKSLIRDTDSRIFISDKNGSLFINNALGSDSGIYTCEIVIDPNLPPILSKRNVLHVIENLKFVPQPTSKNLELGSLGKVHCKAQGTPTPHVKWIKSTNELLPNNVEDINGTLIFKNVSFEHRGNFTCIATNDQGEINATVNVNVVVAPQFLVVPENTIEFVEFETAIMHCQAIGDPKPTVQWDKNLKYFSNSNIDQERFQLLENGTLIIHNVQQKDEGIYGCTIGNSAGLKRGEARLSVKNSDVEDAPNGLIPRAVLITMSFAFTYIILVVTLMIWCRYRRQARKSHFNEISAINEESGKVKKSTDEYEPCLTDDLSDAMKTNQITNDNCNNTRNDTQKSDDTACSNQSKISKMSNNVYELYNMQRSSIKDMILIGSGEFGNVYIGKMKVSLVKQFIISHNDDVDHENKRNINNVNRYVMTNLINKMKAQSKTSMENDIEEIQEEHELNVKEEKLAIMIKAFNKVNDDMLSSEFKRQIDMFRSVKNKNVVKLFGLCQEKEPHYMLLEYLNWGDLKEFLLATAGKVIVNANTSCKPPPLNTGQVLAVAYQIANGMDAIYRARFVHKDLATRNCIISSDFIVKVSYPSLCMDKYCKEYFKYRNSMVPIRWSAPECILDNDYTIKSDVYSFGVVVWELFTQAMYLPLENLNNDEIIQHTQTGKVKHHLADQTPEILKDILKSCWKMNAKERPSFSQLCSAFTTAIQSINK